MLLNSKGQIVNLRREINSKTHPAMMAQLHEVLEPAEKFTPMFQLGERAKFKQVADDVQ